MIVGSAVPRRRTARKAPTFDERLEELRTYVTTHGTIPPASTAVGVWLRRQRLEEAAGKLAASAVRRLDSAAPAWRVKNANGHFTEEELVALVTRHHTVKGRLPSFWHGDDKGLVAALRRAASSSTPHALDDAHPGWRDAYREDADARARREIRDLSAWVSVHGRIPAAAGERPGERRAAGILERKRAEQRARTLPAWEAAALDESCPGWAGPERRDMATQLRDYWDANRRLPSRDDTGAAAGLYRKLTLLRATLRMGTLPAETIRALDATVPGWRVEQHRLAA